MNDLRIYNCLPIFMQNLVCSSYGLSESFKRYGRGYKKFEENLKSTEFYNNDNIHQYQESALKDLIIDAYENVEYYNKLFKSLKLTPSDFQTIEDLKKLPVLTKEMVILNHEQLINKRFSKNRLILGKTSGTTGKSLKFYTTKKAIRFQWAIWWRHRSRFGFRFGAKHLNFTGKPVVPQNQNSKPYWRWNIPFNQAIINMQSLTLEKTLDIVKFIEKEKFDFWTGYPSIINNFCLNLIEQNIQLNHKPKVIFLGAETIYDDQKKNISEVTNAVITDQYGFSEGAANASQCEHFRHHEDFEFGIFECVDPEYLYNGEIRGKIVCTGFANKAYPLIRYEVGDIGIWDNNNQFCECGRSSKILKKIEGRTEDFVITPEGNRIMRFDYIFKDTNNIKEVQVVQKDNASIQFNIVKRAEYSYEDEKIILSKVKIWISPSINVSFNYVEDIIRERNGKFRAVKSELIQIPA